MKYLIEINEGIVEATRRGCDWWFARRQMFEASDKLCEVKAACVVGGIVAIGPYDEEDARFMATHMIEVGGLPASAVKVKLASLRCIV